MELPAGPDYPPPSDSIGSVRIADPDPVIFFGGGLLYTLPSDQSS